MYRMCRFPGYARWSFLVKAFGSNLKLRNLSSKVKCVTEQNIILVEVIAPTDYVVGVNNNCYIAERPGG